MAEKPASEPATPPRRAAAPARPALPPEDTGTARVHLAANYANAWLELRSHVDDTPWRRICAAPCDRALHVEGMEARVSAPGMTTSNVFRLQAGRGTARFRVNGGPAKARETGLILMIAGVPVALGGFTVLGYGGLKKNDGVQAAGAVTLGIGTLAVLVALPLLVSGSTTVRDGRGDVIAGASPATTTH